MIGARRYYLASLIDVSAVYSAERKARHASRYRALVADISAGLVKWKLSANLSPSMVTGFNMCFRPAQCLPSYWMAIPKRARHPTRTIITNGILILMTRSAGGFSSYATPGAYVRENAAGHKKANTVAYRTISYCWIDLKWSKIV